jgi:hypothetical protein
MSCQQRLDASSDAPSGDKDKLTATTDQPSPTCDCGGAFAHGFWQCGFSTNFDMCITDTQSCSYWNKDYQKVLGQQEKEKKNQHAWKCRWTSPH